MNVTKEDFIDWKAQPVTKRLYAAIQYWIEVGKEELSVSAGSDPLIDKERVGKLNAYRELLDLKFDSLETEENDN